MRVAVVAGPDAGHAIPAIALSLRLRAHGDDVRLYTGRRWFGPLADCADSIETDCVDADAVGPDGIGPGRAECGGISPDRGGLDVVGPPDERGATAGSFIVCELPGLAPRPEDDDTDIGARLHERAGYIASLLAPLLREWAPDVVISDVLTAGGGLAAQLCGIEWIELSPHPLYLPSRGLPPIGMGLAPGTGVRGHVRDIVLRALTARSVRQGAVHRRRVRASLGLPDKGGEPALRLVATLPALEVPRPDWPREAHLIGPLHWEPFARGCALPPGDAPLVVVAPSTAETGAPGLLAAALTALGSRPVRVVVSVLDASVVAEAGVMLPLNAVVGSARQDELLAGASAVICGGGHGLLSKALLAGVPAVIAPGGGDQWELASRAARAGVAVVVRPVDVRALGAAVDQVLNEGRFRTAARAAAQFAARVSDPVALCHSLVSD